VRVVAQRQMLNGRLDRALAPHFVVAVVLLMAAAASLLAAAGTLIGDLRFEAASRDASGNVVVVAIDPPSISHVGAWPWPRSVYSKLITRLEDLGATDIGFDIEMSSPSTPDQDTALAEALARATVPIVLPVLQQPLQDGGVTSNVPLPVLAAHAWLASVNVAPDPDGRVRRYPTTHAMDGTSYPSFARQLVGGGDDRPEFWIDFGIRAETIPILSAADVLMGRIDRSVVEGRRVIVGGTALELGDRHGVPHYGVLAGPIIQALAAETLLQNRLLQPVAGPFIGAGLLVIALVFQLTRGSLLRCCCSLLAIAAAGEYAAVVALRDFAVLVDTTPWLGATALYLLIGTVMALGVARLIARVSTHSFNVVAAGIRDGVLHLDGDGKICFANEAAARIFDRDHAQLIGMPFTSLVAGGCDVDRLAMLSAREAGCWEFDGRRADGTVALEMSVSIWPSNAPYSFSLILRDISERKAEAERQRRLARTDALTDLPNRLALLEHLAVLSEPTDGGSAASFALLLFDLDGFKEINDAFGHETGDASLVTFSKALRSVTGECDFAARLGGDEFALVLTGPEWRSRFARIMADYETLFAARYFNIGHRRLKLASSMGAAVFPDDGSTPGELLANADLALYAVKGTQHHAKTFTWSLRQEREQVRAVQAELRRALDRDEFVLFYQPQYDIASGRMVGAEALIRWQHPERGLLSPGAFMDAVHASDLSDAVAIHVLQTGFRQAALWKKAGHPLRVGVNLSPSLFLLDLPALVAKELAQSKADPSCIELEVTENILLNDSDSAGALLQRLRDLGVHVAFDDFGTGYASLTHLRSLPINCIKIDRSFVTDVAVSRPAATIVGGIVQMADAFGIRVIAEGIENADTVRALRLLGCHEGQGYHFGRPQPAADLERRLTDQLKAA
jgi:diguanylate cyclase (GGDEF)-like protein/PAS domain S-box-containing protein